MRTVESTALDTSLDLDTLQGVLQEYPVDLAILFGSHATGTAHATSDIDLAVAFDDHRPPDPSYNDVFLGLSADLSDALGTDNVDLVDLHTASPALVTAIFERGILLVGEPAHAAELRQQLPTAESDQESPRDRLDAALDRIDDHLGDGDCVPASGDSEDNR
jgi:predicted nucleotidyltransferase